MPVQRPKLDKPVCFVRRDGDDLLWTLATLYRDMSCGFTYPEPDVAPDGLSGWTQCSCDPAPDNWERAVESLRSLGFAELREARASGLVPARWVVGGSMDGYACRIVGHQAKAMFYQTADAAPAPGTSLCEGDRSSFLGGS